MNETNSAQRADLVGITSENYADFTDAMGVEGIAAFYTVETGEINWFVSGTLGLIILNHQACGRPFIGVPARTELDAHMVQAGQIVERPEMPAYLDGNVLRAVPAGCGMEVNGEYVAATDSEIELHGPPGETLTILLYCWPYKNKELRYASPAL